MNGTVRRSTAKMLAACGLLAGTIAVGVAPAVAVGGATCTGTEKSPGVLAGTYASNVTVQGLCAVNAGQALVGGNLTVRPGSALIAAFGLNDRTHSGTSSLQVMGNLDVQKGATVILGCDAQSSPCVDDPAPEHPTLSSPGGVSGNLVGQEALGVLVHNSVIGGNLEQTGGGGGFTCEPSGIFASFAHSPVFSAYDDSSVRGNVLVSGMSSCYLGLARLQVGGNMTVIKNQLADPDAIEILSNRIAGNLLCSQNSQVWDNVEANFGPLFPRIPKPNTVQGRRSGQCVLASPNQEKGSLGPGPF